MWRVVHVGLVAAWLMMNGMSSLSTDALTAGKNICAPDPDPYPVQRFKTLSTNPRQTYLDLIRGIRSILTDDQLDPVFEIPRLVDRDSVPGTRRFILVELINSNEDNITVAIDTTRLYVVGYRRANEFHYFNDTAEGVKTLFPNLTYTRLPFNSSYGALAREGGRRSTTTLGIASLEQAIIDLQDYNRPHLARSFTVIIQMISEPIRFRYIENFIGGLIRRQVVQVPYQTMLDLENEWGSLSNRIQNSVDGTLDPPVLLTNREGIRSPISTVTRGLAFNIGILYFVCNRSPNAYQLSLIRTGGGTYSANISEPIIRLPTEKGSAHLEAAGDTCEIGEPTIRIIGRNGLCADVRDGFYKNGNPIILWPCKSNEDVNQLWTLKADGTIRSNGKCLTTYGYAPGHYIMIYDCSTAAPDATKWDIWDDGTILNPKSSLVLSATSGNTKTTLTMVSSQAWVVANNTQPTVTPIMNNNGDMCLEDPDYNPLNPKSSLVLSATSGNITKTILTLQQNLYASSQAWVVANNTQPTVTPIMNYNGDMCLEAPDYNPRIVYRGCQSGESRQSFAVYPDGSIRPDKTRDDCLTADTKNSVVVTAGCNGGAEQRWSFNRDYTISNLDTGLAIDAQNDVISLNPRELQESQEWHAWLL